MSRPSWAELLRGFDAEVEGDLVTVRFEDRKHRVRVRESEDTYELHAVVARAAVMQMSVADLAVRIWRHNRSAQLVSFSLDRHGRVCGRGWVPKAGLVADEFQMVLRRVAAESDRLEFLLTGRDVE